MLVLTALTEKFIDGLLCRVIEAVMVLVALSNYSGCRINYQVSCGFIGPLVWIWWVKTTTCFIGRCQTHHWRWGLLSPKEIVFLDSEMHQIGEIRGLFFVKIQPYKMNGKHYLKYINQDNRFWIGFVRFFDDYVIRFWQVVFTPIVNSLFVLIEVLRVQIPNRPLWSYGRKGPSLKYNLFHFPGPESLQGPSEFML